MAINVGVVATSSVIPPVELELGIEKLRSAGLNVHIHPHCLHQHLTFAGQDLDRAQAFWDLSQDKKIDILWAARGGYGATRLLPILERWTTLHGPPPRKLLVGYSDITALHHFVRARWNWKTLHAVMVGGTQILSMKDSEWQATLALIQGDRPRLPWVDQLLRFITPPPVDFPEGQLVGGNLTVWNALTGTPFMPTSAPRILFLEDVGEQWYRVDRMMTQLHQAGGLEGVRAIILGDFTHCDDEPPTGLSQRGSTARSPIRPRIESAHALASIFSDKGIPVALGLPVGHGNNLWPLPLGCQCRLSPHGHLEWWGWD
jgi:muramoyltetrapeptide carboxypeptidase